MTRQQASLQTATRQERNLRIFPMTTFALCAVRIRTLSPLQIKGGWRNSITPKKARMREKSILALLFLVRSYKYQGKNKMFFVSYMFYKYIDNS